MKTIISWNVNGIRAAEKKGMFSWLRDADPDIFCIQETKAHPDQLNSTFLQIDGYHPYFSSAEKRGYSGVAVYTKEKPLDVSLLGLPEFDGEGRTLIMNYSDFVLVNCYFPNSQEKGARLAYKLEFCDAVMQTCDKLVQEGKNILLCGDYNIAHKPIDLEYPDRNDMNPGYLPEERAWMDSFTRQGYVDTFRMFNQEPKNYTWWSYRTRARERNIGWRIDYHCVNEGFAGKVASADILHDVAGSDHCPVLVRIDS